MRSRTSAGIPCNDRHDVDPHELTLIRAGQHLWSLWKKENSGKSQPPDEESPIYKALQTIWAMKAKYREELKEKRKRESLEMAKRFKKL
jgi:hypothetical protein